MKARDKRKEYLLPSALADGQGDSKKGGFSHMKYKNSNKNCKKLAFLGSYLKKEQNLLKPDEYSWSVTEK